MNEIEMQRLAHAINELRPDWPISSLTTFFAKGLQRRPYRDVAVAMVWVAADRNPDGTWASETPRRVLEAGPWWRAAMAGEQAEETLTGGSKLEQCPTCNKRTCICRPEEPVAPMPIEDARKLARAAVERRGA